MGPKSRQRGWVRPITSSFGGYSNNGNNRTFSLAHISLERTLSEMNYDTVREWLADWSRTLDPSEVHGSLCGVIASSYRLKLNDWQVYLFAELPEEASLDSDKREIAERFIQQVMNDFTDPNGVFDPMLPDDDEPLDARVAALASWCRGFVAGLSIGGIAEPSRLPGVCGEIAQDLADIAKADFEDESEEEESAYSELVEYVRVSSLLFLEELGQLSTDQNDQPKKDYLDA